MSRRKEIRETVDPAEIYATALKNSPDAEALVKAYQQNIPETPKAKAEAEARIWEKLLSEDKRIIIRLNGYNSTFLAHALGLESPNAFIARGRTLGWERRGAKVDLAWDALLAGKSSWVIKAVTYAKKAADEHEDQLAGKMDETSITKAVNHKFEAAFLAYKNDPRIHDEEKRVNREAVRERKGKDKPRRAPLPAPAPAKKTRAMDEILVSGDIQESKDIWDEAELLVKERVNPFVRNRLSMFDSESGVDEILNTFYLDLRNVYQDLLTKIRRVRALKSSQAVLEVKREKIRWALETLRVPVQRGWRKEDLDADAIKKQYRSLALRFHPDKPTSDDVTRARFNEVKDAYEVLRDAGLNI